MEKRSNWPNSCYFARKKIFLSQFLFQTLVSINSTFPFFQVCKWILWTSEWVKINITQKWRRGSWKISALKILSINFSLHWKKTEICSHFPVSDFGTGNTRNFCTIWLTRILKLWGIPKDCATFTSPICLTLQVVLRLLVRHYGTRFRVFPAPMPVNLVSFRVRITFNKHNTIHQVSNVFFCILLT